MESSTFGVPGFEVVGWYGAAKNVMGTLMAPAVIIASGIYIVLRESTPSISQNRPVLENRSRWEIGTLPRISSWLKRFDRGGDQA